DDIDGQFRPQAAGPDIGADEYLELVGPASLIISGPTTVVANTDNTFAATVGPINTTRPLTYTWSATGLDDVVHTSGAISDTVTFNWPTTGPKSVSLTVSNAVSGRGETYPVMVISAPALSIEKSGPAEALTGSPILYEITVTNSGVAGASGLVITDTVPANTTSVTPLDGGSVSNGLVQWNLANLAGGSEATFRFQVTAEQTITNDDYAVTAAGGYQAIGATPVTTVVGQPQLSIVKRGPFAAAPGQDIVYQLTISNTGPISATNVVVSDTLPAGATYVSGGQLMGNVVRWEINSIAAGGGVVQVSFTASANATVTNSDYRVQAAGGFSAQGAVSVSTIVGAGTRYVAKGGADGLNNCVNSASPCATIQHAVDVANPGEEIRVAGGAYAGTSWVTSALGYDYKQVVFVAKGITLSGGYSTSDWNNADPLAHPTILDAQGDGRGLTILNTENDVVTVEGFTVTGGDYSGLGNPDGISNLYCSRTGYDCGGGIFISNSAANLRHLVVHDNRAGGSDSTGGGIYIWPVRATTIEYTEVTSNSAGYGGGLYVSDTIFPITINDSTFQDNVADQGGGICLDQSLDHLASLNRVDVINNTALVTTGGGVYVRMSAEGLMLAMDRVRLQGNQAYGQGKALFLDAVGNEVPRANLSNLLLSGNGPTAGAPTADADAIVAVQSKFARLEVDLLHVTAAGNPVTSFLYVEPRDEAGYFVTVALTNTLLSGFDNGYVARETGLGEATIYHEKTLFHNVTNQTLALAGTPTFTAMDAISGDPKLDGTYHLTAGSAAIDVAATTAVNLDIDGDSRPLGDGPDIGADEYVPAPPAAFGKVSPANGAVGQPTAPSLTWETSNGATSYEVCYDTTDNDACDGGWLDAGSATGKTLAALSSGTTYYWQARAVNVLGQVEADGGTWWSFTTGTPPAAFGKSGPTNGAGNQTTTPTLSWGSAGGATSYEYCVDTLNNGNCDGDWVDAGDNQSAALSGLAYGTTYYWQARAVNAIGQTEADGGAWWLFTTGNQPGNFGKSSPADGATIEATSVNLSWTPSSDAVSYEICLDTSDNNSCDDTWTSAGGNTSKAVTGLSMGTTYYWQVRAVNSLGYHDADNWTWWSFSVASPPAAFGKSAPTNGAVDQLGSPTLSWAASAGAGAYEYCIDTSDDGSCEGAWISAGGNTWVALSGLRFSTVYFWQVRAKNGLGTTTADGGAWWSFTTQEPPYAIRLPCIVKG
ncbi:MAG: fibronectin type III domain-containing protein, partial [Chloroflexota bacterium]